MTDRRTTFMWYYSAGVFKDTAKIVCPVCCAEAGEECRRLPDNVLPYHTKRMLQWLESPLSLAARRADENREFF